MIKSGLRVRKILRGKIVIDKSGGFGVFGSDGRFVESSLQLRGAKGQFVPKDLRGEDIQYFDFNAIYLGNLDPHFGHFLLEHMNRMYPIFDKKYKDAKIVFVKDNRVNRVPEFARVLIGLMGIDIKDVVILEETAQFRNVFVPEQAFNIPLFSSREMGDTFARIACLAPAAGKFEKIYLSRAKMGARKTFGEEKLQKIFQKNGYEIIYPETLPLNAQIGLMKNCKSLAGLAGTALHLALFMPAGGNVIQIMRNRQSKSNGGIQLLINKTKGLRSVFISGSIEKFKTAHFTAVPQIVGATPWLKQFLDDNGFEYQAADLKFDNTAWQEYENALEQYRKNNGGVMYGKTKHKAVMLLACLVPGRRNRNLFRNWLNSVL
ncbi:MAG: glycosyltransferase family 61 protein [Rickettsiales bacterium]|nr:glycosyltransferase family 61 protein [Rickettsiales bacterium]